MKKFTCLILIFVVAASLISLPVWGAQKWIRQSEIHPKMTDAFDQSEIAFGNFDVIWYFHGARSETGAPDDGWIRSWLRNAGSRWGCRNWYDPEGDSIMPIRLGGAPYGTSDMSTVQFPVPDSVGVTIRQYFRYHPPSIIVDGIPLQRPTGIGDEYAPDKVWGTADVMVEGHARNWMGLDIYYRMLSWVSKHHNQYIVYDITAVNSGNIDLDDSIEREGEPLDSLYFMRQLEMTVNNQTETKSEWYTWTGVYPDWDEPRDSVRCLISYPAIEWERAGGAPWKGDPLGCYLWQRDYLDDPCSGGEVTLYVPQIDAGENPVKPIGPGPLTVVDGTIAVENHPETDDSTQPKSHGNWGPDDLEYKHNSGARPISDWAQCYNAMIYGEKGDPDYDPYVDWMTGAYPNTYHPVPTDLRGYDRWNDLNQNGLVFWHAMAQAGYGPFHLDYGDSIRIVWAQCGGRLDARSSWELGKAWKDSTITFVTQSGDTLDIDDISLTAPHLPNQADTIHIPPVYRNNTWRWQDAGYACDRANLIKDMWVYSTVDSVVRHSINAQWNFDHNYRVPVPPPPPSIEVTSGADRIVIDWRYEEPADAPSDLAGFRVYRSVGSAGLGPLIDNDGVVGEWEVIYEAGPTENTFSDSNAVRGEDYYYYVAAFDDGTHPEAEDPNGVTGTAESLESGRFQNYTFGVIGAASLKRTTGGALSDIRVVPNPFNIAASGNMGYAGENEKINFFDLPGYCTIKIYTFSGDLIKTIVHDDGSGDEAWVNPTREWYQVTEAGQHIASGLYIANIVDDVTGESINIKFVIIR